MQFYDDKIKWYTFTITHTVSSRGPPAQSRRHGNEHITAETAKSFIRHHVFGKRSHSAVAELWTDVGTKTSFPLAVEWWQWCVSRSSLTAVAFHAPAVSIATGQNTCVLAKSWRISLFCVEPSHLQWQMRWLYRTLRTVWYGDVPCI